MPSDPIRVASVLPSATEILCFIGGSKLLVARSHEDNYPLEITHLPVLTDQKTSYTTAVDVDRQVSVALSAGQSLYTLNEELLTELHVDVILTQDICSVCAIDLPTVQRIAAKLVPPPRVLSLNPLNLDGVLLNLTQVGEAVGLEKEAQAALKDIQSRLAAIDAHVAKQALLESERPAIAFIEWPDPLYVGGHWTPQLIERAGGRHPLNPGRGAEGAGKSFAIPHDKLVDSDPDWIILCFCGLDLAATRREALLLENETWWKSLRAVREGRVALVDGDSMFNRPGPRLVDALEWLYSVFSGNAEFSPVNFPFEWLTSKVSSTDAERSSKRIRAMEDIEDLHYHAVQKGLKHYTDPETGYCVFTQLYMLERGWCCGSGCRHCPFGHQHVELDRKQKIRAPIIVEGFGCPRKSPPKPTS